MYHSTILFKFKTATVSVQFVFQWKIIGNPLTELL